MLCWLAFDGMVYLIKKKEAMEPHLLLSLYGSNLQNNVGDIVFSQNNDVSAFLLHVEIRSQPDHLM